MLLDWTTRIEPTTIRPYCARIQSVSIALSRRYKFAFQLLTHFGFQWKIIIRQVYKRDIKSKKAQALFIQILGVLGLSLCSPISSRLTFSAQLARRDVFGLLSSFLQCTPSIRTLRSSGSSRSRHRTSGSRRVSLVAHRLLWSVWSWTGVRSVGRL